MSRLLSILLATALLAPISALAQDSSSLAGSLWLDLDGNGLSDPGEPAFSGITVELLDGFGQPLDAQQTLADGSFLFGSLAAGDYILRPLQSGLPSGLEATFEDDLSFDGEVAVTLGAGEGQAALDFGYQGTGSVAGGVFEDVDADGAQGAGEFGIVGVDVAVVEVTIGPVGLAPTASDGSFLVEGLPAGAYVLTLDAATIPGMTPVSDPDGTADHTTSVSLIAAEARSDLNFGYNTNGSLGDRLYLDLNGNGAEDAGEPGIVGASLELLDDVGTPMASTLSTAGGAYGFTNVPSEATLTLRVDPLTLPLGLTQSADPDALFDHETTLILSSGEERDDLDFGYVGSAALGDLVFLDFNGDGVQDPGENGLPGVTLRLTDTASGEVVTTTNDASGIYGFSGLPAQEYLLSVHFDTPSGLNPVSDPDGQLDSETTVTTLVGTALLDLDFGYGGGAMASGRVFTDSDKSGGETPGDQGFEGVGVDLLDDQGSPLLSTITQAEGDYVFGNLLPGSYVVLVDASTLPLGAGPALDPDGVLDHETIVTLGESESLEDLDFGYSGDSGIDASLFEDADGNGSQGGEEPSLEGVSVHLLDDQGTVLDTQVTDSGGYVFFFDLLAGTYYLEVDASTVPVNYTLTYDSDGVETPGQIAVPLGASEYLFGGSFGYAPPGGIDASLFEDADGNGSQGGEEPALEGVSVHLLDDQGAVLATEVTDSGGYVFFFELLAGTYYLEVDESTVPVNYTLTYDSDGVETPGRIEVPLGTSEYLFGGSFGYAPPGGIDASLFEDADGNGSQGGSEPSLEGVSVHLLDDQGAVLATEVTDSGGYVFFFELLAGTYYLEVDESTVPVNYTLTYDSDGVETPGRIEVPLGTSEYLFGGSFGYAPPGGIDASLFEDADGNGSQGGEEPSLEGVSVHLLDDQGAVLAAEVTDSGGYVFFFELLAGTYYLEVDESTVPVNYTLTYDTDGVETPGQIEVPLGTSEYLFGGSFGYAPPGEVSTTVWEDLNSNGLQDAGEPGLSGVSVQLLDDQGAALGSLVTDTAGHLTFDSLLAGAYRLVVDSSTLPVLVPTFDSDGVVSVHIVDFTLATAEAAGVAFGYANSAPSVTISAPTDGTLVNDGSSLTFVGAATDPEEGDLGGSLVWTSSIDGALGSGASVGATLSVGAHTITASVTDGGGLSDSATVLVTVNGGPSVTITSPVDGSVVNDGSPVAFIGSVSDHEDGDLTGSLVWTSSIDGALGNGGSVGAVLSVGTHTITASATDAGGLSDSASIVVTVNGGPSISISSPADGTLVNDGNPLTFIGSASDIEDGDIADSVAWTSSIDGALGSGGSVGATLSVGTHTITASVSDSDGLSNSAAIVVTVNGGPSVTITSPADGTLIQAGENLSFIGSATDAEDGDLASTILWASSIDGAFGTGGAVGVTLSAGVHVVTATVGDSGGLGALDSIVVTVNAAPAVTITAPTDGAEFDAGTNVSLGATASDLEDGDLSASILWVSSIDGALGSGGSLDVSLSVGTHTISAEVTDAAFATSSVAITLTVNPAPELWMSFRSNTVVPGVGTVADEDIVSYNEVSGIWNLEFDGSDVGLGGLEISALAVLPGGDLLVSFTQPGTVGGLSVDDSDILRFTPSSMGSDTAGSFTLYFDGSDVGMSNNGEDIDAITFAPDGSLVLSTVGSIKVSGLTGRDEDLVLFTGTVGDQTSGSFEMYFDGSDVGLSSSSSEDIDAASLTQDGHLLFSTIGNFSVSGVSGPDEDVVSYTGVFGSSTSGSFALRQDLTSLGILDAEDIGSLHLVEQ